MRVRDVVLYTVGQLVGRGIQEGTELLPFNGLIKKGIRAGIGIGEIVAAIKARISPDAQEILAISGSKIIADELVDTVLEIFAKPVTPAASLKVPVKVEAKVEKAKAGLW